VHPLISHNISFLNHSQIESLKDVVSLTKDMLGIREIEVRDLTERMEAMAVKFKAERDCKALMQKKMQLSDQLNSDLKSEYKAQKEIFEVSPLRDMPLLV
jgi:membrane protease subunit (stomatin/prohibitin family)